MNTLHGTELFTGNTMKLPAAIYEGKSTFGKLCHNWFWSYLGNFVGSLALVWLVVQSGVLANCTGYAIKTAMAKGTLPWMQCFLRAVMANWLELVTTDARGAIVFKNAWATSHAITDHNVAALASAGRARWKIENENNNTLKTKGYHFDHNFGHGKQFLANLFATLILLAFLVHTALDWMDTR
jgi:hypothetical protein